MKMSSVIFLTILPLGNLKVHSIPEMFILNPIRTTLFGILICQRGSFLPTAQISG